MSYIIGIYPENDIALLKLKKSVEFFFPEIVPICLPQPMAIRKVFMKAYNI